MKIGDKIHLLSYDEIVERCTCEKASNITVDDTFKTIYGIHREVFDNHQNTSFTIKYIQQNTFVVMEFPYVFPIEVIRPTYKVELI